MNKTELCTECLGEGRIIQQSKALEAKLVLKKCKTCRGAGITTSIMNSAFINNEIRNDMD